jgi:hypothetical protein
MLVGLDVQVLMTNVHEIYLPGANSGTFTYDLPLLQYYRSEDARTVSAESMQIRLGPGAHGS